MYEYEYMCTQYTVRQFVRRTKNPRCCTIIIFICDGEFRGNRVRSFDYPMTIVVHIDIFTWGFISLYSA